MNEKHPENQSKRRRRYYDEEFKRNVFEDKDDDEYEDEALPFGIVLLTHPPSRGTVVK